MGEFSPKERAPKILIIQKYDFFVKIENIDSRK